jgi:hypothetical protein
VTIDFYRTKLVSKKEVYKNGYQQNAKFYEVTGECLKMIAMDRNNEIRKYYITVEELAMFMRDYILALHQYINAKQMKEMTLKLNDKRLMWQK